MSSRPRAARRPTGTVHGHSFSRNQPLQGGGEEGKQGMEQLPSKTGALARDRRQRDVDDGLRQRMCSGENFMGNSTKFEFLHTKKNVRTFETVVCLLVDVIAST